MLRYYWNFNKDEEVWFNSENTIEECLKAAREQNKEKKDIVFIAISSDFIPCVDPDDVIDRNEEQANEECGECSEGWLTGLKQPIIDELGDLLTETFTMWLENNNLKPSFGKFDDMWCYDLETGERLDSEMENEYMRSGY